MNPLYWDCLNSPVFKRAQQTDLASSGRGEEYKVEEGLLYSKDHEWVKRQDERDATSSSSSTPVKFLVGITDYAAKMLHDIVYVQLPRVGQNVKDNDTLCQVESIKTVADVFSPLSGKVLRINESLTTQPEKVSQSPYGEGWMVEIESSSPEESLKSLMNASQYREYVLKIQTEQ
jgi:glycine cleavage system H protein